MSARSALAAALVLGLALPVWAQPTTSLETAFTNLSFTDPVELTHANDGSGRLYVAEKDGQIRSFDNVRSATASTMFLDLSARSQNSGERGLLGLAFHPNYAANGHVYVHYSANDGRMTVSRFTRSASNPLVADPASEQFLFQISDFAANHNGGKIAFGPDGYLYVSFGDGGGGGDPMNYGQNRTVLFGKLLRVDVDAPSAGFTYGIPPSNPYQPGNVDGFRPEIYAYGLRNMWKFAFDRQDGTLWGADVGQNVYEEINLIANGENYGWRIMEGAHCFNPSTGCNQAGLALPIYEYTHAGGACSVTGGNVYRGARNADLLAGDYVFGDYCAGTVWALDYDGTTATRRTLAQTGFGLIAFGEDADGELYVLRQTTGPASILRFVPTVVAGEPSAPSATPPLRVVGANPFADRTTVELVAAADGPARLAVLDALGREVAVLLDGPLAAGERRLLAIDGAALAPGVYLVRLTAVGGATTDLRLVRAR